MLQTNPKFGVGRLLRGEFWVGSYDNRDPTFVVNWLRPGEMSISRLGGQGLDHLIQRRHRLIGQISWTPAKSLGQQQFGPGQR
jgi:hypothetical protein